MARLNRLPLALAVFSALMASQAHALGLGDITLHSALNQPLDAEIELLQVGDLSADDLVAHLANAAAFERLGIDRSLFLQNLHFTPVIRNGRSYIRVVSDQPVREPYLNFLLELERPNGGLLREYTVLLDPPGYNAGAGAGNYAYAGAARPAGKAYNAAPRPAKRRQAQAARPAVPATAGDGRYTTRSGDTLWSIAGRLSGNGVSRQELMAQLQQLNPQAFVGGNPHHLKLGQTLVLPAGKATAAPSPATAPAAAPDAAAAAAQTPAAAPVSEAAVNQAQGQLADLTAERDRLNQRMDNLQQQLSSLQQALESRDQQVQNLQAELARRQAAAQAPATPPAAAPAAAPVPEAATAKPVDKPAAAVSGPQSSDPARWPWAAAAGVVVLLIAGLLYRRRREEQPATPPQVEPLAASLPPQEPVRPQPTLAARPLPVVAPVAADSSLAKLPAASSDSLEGANIYIAYGRFGQARDMLVKSIAAEPQRRDLRMKLMLVLAELGDVAGFREQESALQAIGGDQKQIDQLKMRYPAMLERPGEETLLGDSLGEWDGLELDEEPHAPARPEPAPAADSELNLGELSMDLDWSSLDAFDVPPAKSAAKPQEEVFLDDFRSNLRELPEVTEFDLDGEHAGAFGLPERQGAASAEHDKLLAGLDQARACIDRGDLDEAYRILKRVLEDGDSHEREEARELLARIA